MNGFSRTKMSVFPTCFDNTKKNTLILWEKCLMFATVYDFSQTQNISIEVRTSVQQETDVEVCDTAKHFARQRRVVDGGR